MKTLADNSVDAIVTDPPYGLSFMGKKWDYDVPSVEVWREALRVLKPGGHLLSFGGTRTYHRLVVNIEDAGFEIRDCIQWLYGSGFPKSHDISKAIDKSKGAKREVVGENPNNRDRSKHNYNSVGNVGSEAVLTAPATDEAKQWSGWGTALKPANEPICVARKPLEKGLTVASNVLKFGTGALNIDASRIGTEERTVKAAASNEDAKKTMGAFKPWEGDYKQVQGRWPANVLLDEEAAQVLDEQSGYLHGSGNKSDKASGTDKSYEASSYEISYAGRANRDYGSKGGGASRFFYIAKASKRERNQGLEGMPSKKVGMSNGAQIHGDGYDKAQGIGLNVVKEMQNFHPTVKPVKLMEYLIKLVTPPHQVWCEVCKGKQHENVRTVREEIQAGSAKPQDAVLLKTVLGESDGAREAGQSGDYSQGLSHDLCSRESDGEYEGHGHGTQNDNGKSSGAMAEIIGDSSPHQRRQSRQSHRKSRASEQKNTRQASKAASETNPMSSLLEPSEGVGPCATCGTPLKIKHSVVLDPFCGSGTTGVACKNLGFNFIGCELNEEYAQIAEKRIGA